MASPRAAQAFAPQQTPIPGQGKNVNLDAMSDALDRGVQRSQITAQLQAESMRMAMDGAQMQVAAAQDLGRGITEAAEAFSTRQETKRQREFLSAEAQKARESVTARERTQQSAQMKIQKSREAAIKVNTDATNASQATLREADRTAVQNQAKLARLDVEGDILRGHLASGKHLSKDPKKAKAEVETLKEQIREIEDEKRLLGGGVSKAMLENGFAIASSASLATKQNTQALLRVQQRLKMAESKRSQAIAQKKQQLTVQVPAFAGVDGEKNIDGGLAAGVTMEDMATRVMMLYNDTDMSNPRTRGYGMIRAMAQDPTQDAELLNQVQGKLGPFGMATVDAFLIEMEGWDDALGEAESSEIQRYRDGTISIVRSRISKAIANPSYSALQISFASDMGRIFLDNYRQENGHPASEQEFDNWKRGLDLSHIPGNLDMKFIYGVMGPTVPINGLHNVTSEETSSALSGDPAGSGLSIDSQVPQSEKGKKIGLRGIGAFGIKAAQALAGPERKVLPGFRSFRP